MDILQNISCHRDKDDIDHVFHTYVALILLLALVCMVSNGLVMWVIPKEPKLWVPLNYFILSLAVSDFTHGVVFSIYTIGHIEKDVILNVLGKFLIYMMYNYYT